MNTDNNNLYNSFFKKETIFQNKNNNESLIQNIYATIPNYIEKLRPIVRSKKSVDNNLLSFSNFYIPQSIGDCVIRSFFMTLSFLTKDINYSYIYYVRFIFKIIKI